MGSECRILLFDGELRLSWYNGAAAEAWSLDASSVGEHLETLATPRDWIFASRVARARVEPRSEQVSEAGRLVLIEPASPPLTGVLVADLEPETFASDGASTEAMWRRLASMAAVVAHEVKNPLAGVTGALHVIAGRLPEGSPERSIVAEMQARLSGLNATIDELLLFARPVRVRGRPASVRDLVDAAIVAAERHLDAGRISFVVEGQPDELNGDPDLLRHAIRNVLINAAQASPTGGRVLVGVKADAGRIEVRISDAGPGVPAEIQQLIFQPFFTRKSRGTGLGLTVARRIIEAHGGTINLAINDAPGATFVIALPLGLAVTG